MRDLLHVPCKMRDILEFGRGGTIPTKWAFIFGALISSFLILSSVLCKLVFGPLALGYECLDTRLAIRERTYVRLQVSIYVPTIRGSAVFRTPGLGTYTHCSVLHTLDSLSPQTVQLNSVPQDWSFGILGIPRWSCGKDFPPSPTLDAKVAMEAE